MTSSLKKLKIDKEDKNMDFVLLFVLLILLCIGLIALSSASSYTALTTKNDSNYYFRRQFLFAVLGIVAMLFVSKIDCKTYERFSYLAYIVGIILMLLVTFSGLGEDAKGATRWLDLGIVTVQPSEIMKLALIMALSAYISNNARKMNSLKGYIIPICMIALVCAILYFQSHLSAMILMFLISAIILFASGIKIDKKYLIIGGIVVAIVVVVLVITQGYRMDRILSFLNPDEDITGGNWQPTQSLYAIGSGGIFGAGMGQSRQKYLWLPEAQNDFVFSIWAEEFGFIGCVIVMALFAVFIYRGVAIAIKSRDLYSMLVCTGITGMFALQIIVNIAVVTKLMPTTGMSLPFFSYGGTSILVYLVSVGMILSISRGKRGE